MKKFKYSLFIVGLGIISGLLNGAPPSSKVVELDQKEARKRISIRPQSAPTRRFSQERASSPFGKFRVFMSIDSGRGSSISMRSSRPLLSETPPVFIDEPTSPVAIFIQKMTQVNRKMGIFKEEELLKTFEVLRDIEPLIYESGLYIDPEEPLTISRIETSFLLHDRVKEWIEKPQEALVKQGYVKGEEEISPKLGLLQQFGEDLIIIGHSFPTIIDRFIDWARLTLRGGALNLILPGAIQRLTLKEDKAGNKQLYVDEFKGSYTWAVTKESKKEDRPVFFHRTFKIGEDFSSGARQHVQKELNSFFKDSVLSHESEGRQKESFRVKKILISRIDMSVAFVTEDAAYVLTKKNPNYLFIVYKPKKIGGEQKSHHLPQLFDKFGNFSFSERVLWPIPERSSFVRPSVKIYNALKLPLEELEKFKLLFRNRSEDVFEEEASSEEKALEEELERTFSQGFMEGEYLEGAAAAGGDRFIDKAALDMREAEGWLGHDFEDAAAAVVKDESDDDWEAREDRDNLKNQEVTTDEW